MQESYSHLEKVNELRLSRHLAPLELTDERLEAEKEKV